MMHRLTMRDPSWARPYGATRLSAPRPWLFTCDNPECRERRKGQPDRFIHAGPSRARAIWAARLVGWHVSRYGTACPCCENIWDSLMMSQAHRDLSLTPRRTPDPDLTSTPYRLIRLTTRQTT